MLGLLHAHVEFTDGHHEYNNIRKHSNHGCQAHSQLAKITNFYKPD